MYYLAKRILVRITKDTITARAQGYDSRVCISGIGQHDQQEARLPPPGYDIRDVLKGRHLSPLSRRGKLKLRYLMSEDEKKEWKFFERNYGPM